MRNVNDLFASGCSGRILTLAISHEQRSIHQKHDIQFFFSVLVHPICDFAIFLSVTSSRIHILVFVSVELRMLSVTFSDRIFYIGMVDKNLFYRNGLMPGERLVLDRVKKIGR